MSGKIIFKNQNIFLFLLACITILVTFGLGTTLSFINPANISFFKSGDAGEHYFGWAYFRITPWSFPVMGKIDSYGAPSGTTIVFTDSIPLLAIPLKFFDTIFPDVIPPDFQYLGVWILASFLLQSFFAIKLIQRFLPDIRFIEKFLVLLCFTFAFPLIFRTFAHRHEALTAHWLILASILLYFRREIEQSFPVLKWGCLIFLALAIHAYFVPMVGVFFAADELKYIFREPRKAPNFIVTPASQNAHLGSTKLRFWLAGKASNLGTFRGSL